MKYVLGAFAACLSLLIFTNTNSKPVINYNQITKECTLPGFCAIRGDEFCRWFNHTCDMDDINCQLDELWRLWSQTYDDTQCQFAKKPNQVVLCKGACPVKNCKPDGPVCAADNSKNSCEIVESLCELKRTICENPSQRELFHADMRRCTRAGLHKVGDKGRC